LRRIVVTVDSDKDLQGLRRVGRVVALARDEMKRAVEPGMTTRELDRIGAGVFERYGARSAPNLVYGFPGTNCISLNDEAVHGIPSPERTIRPGDLVKIDVTAELGGYMADSAVTVALPGGEEVNGRLVGCAELAYVRAASVARAGRPMNKIGRAIETAAKKGGFFVLRELNSHGIGRSIHEAPSIPQYYDRRFDAPLTKGLVITIEPILSAGSSRVKDGGDGFTLRTADGSPSVHHEHTIVVTRGTPITVTEAPGSEVD
jgi:methionyl aminopeptidase